MKKRYAFIFAAMAAAVFTISFFIGRATALRDRENAAESELYTGAIPVKELFETELDLPTAAKGVAKKTETENTKAAVPEEIEKVDRMIAPINAPISKPYSQTALYSETTDDWRAHTAIDYAAEENQEVYAAANGTVKSIRKDKLWGWCVEIDHGGGLSSIYKNLQKNIPVKEGDLVKSGQAVAYVGKSAAIERKENAHLHFEICQDGECINPEAYIY